MKAINVNELRKKKAELKLAAETLLNGAVSSTRDMNSEEQTQYDAHVAEIRRIESALTRHAELAQFTEDPAIDDDKPAIRASSEDAEGTDPRATKEYKSAWMQYLRKGLSGMSREVLAALNITTPADGGYATAIEFDTNLVEKLVNVNVMRQLASVITTGSDRKIVVENAVGSADWAAEAAVAHNDDESDDDTLTQVSLSAYKLTRIVKVSEELLQDAFFDIQGWLTRKFANAFGIAEESAFVLSAGSTKPTGVVNGASAGTTTVMHNAITGDELLAAFHSLKRAYRANATWLMNDSTALLIRKLKETTGQYLWQPGLQAGKPDQLLGKPVAISDFVPSATVAGNKALLFGDFSYYTIADRTPRSFTRLNELYAANGQVGFRGVERVDGKVVLSEAIQYTAMGSGS